MAKDPMTPQAHACKIDGLRAELQAAILEAFEDGINVVVTLGDELDREAARSLPVISIDVGGLNPLNSAELPTMADVLAQPGMLRRHPTRHHLAGVSLPGGGQTRSSFALEDYDEHDQLE
jgi:hypothetical protein